MSKYGTNEVKTKIMNPSKIRTSSRSEASIWAKYLEGLSRKSYCVNKLNINPNVTQKADAKKITLKSFRCIALLNGWPACLYP